MSGEKLKLTSLQFAVTDVAAPLSADDLWVRKIIFYLATGEDTVYLGEDDAVTDSNGFPILAANPPLEIDLADVTPNDPKQINLADIYAVCASAGSATLNVLALIVADE